PDVLAFARRVGNPRQTSSAACKILVNGLNGACPLSHGSRHSLDRATPRVAGGKDTGPACLEIMRRPNLFPLGAGGGAGQHKPILVQGDAIAKPPGIGPGSKEKKHVLDGLVFDLPLPVPPYRLEFRLAAQLEDRRPRVKRDVGCRVDPPDQIIRHTCTESAAANDDMNMK